MKTVASLVFFLSVLLLTGGASSFAACDVDLCFSICAHCEGHAGDCSASSYWHVCADSTVNGYQGSMTSCDGNLFSSLELDMFGDSGKFQFNQKTVWLAYGSTYGIPEAWFIELSRGAITGVGAWTESPDVQCIVSGERVPPSNCSLCP